MSRPFLHNSFALYIALPLVLIVPVFRFTGCATPSARPQAEPLSDNKVTQTRPGTTPREKMVEIVLTEWDRWGRRVVRVERDDTHYVAGDGFPGQSQGRWLTPGDPMPILSNEGSGADTPPPKVIAGSATPVQVPYLRYPNGTGGEATARDRTLAERYRGIVDKTPTYQQLTTSGWAWSAVFISQIMRKAGLQSDRFPTGATYTEYMTDVCDHLLRHPAFVLERIPAVPCPGDLICTAHGADRSMTDPAEIQAGRTPIHYDLVAEVDPVRHEVKPIDGNIQQSASTSITELNDANQLGPYTNSVMQWLVVLYNQLPQRTAGVTLFDARRKFANM